MIRNYPIGDACLCWSFGETMEESTVRKTLCIYKKLKGLDLLEKWGIHDIVPSYKSVALHFNPSEMKTLQMEEELDRIIREEWEILEKSSSVPDVGGKEVVLPVLYSGEDLSRVAKHCCLTEKEVIKLHCEGVYLVAMVGFKPHFPYLLGLHPALETPRLDSPRTRIPAGAVAIGGGQTGVYPEESPGGWNLIGQTNPDLLKQVEPGDRIIMREVKR